MPPGALDDALGYLEALLGAAVLVDEIDTSSMRISNLVATMEGYSYMDRAPTQEVDVNEGLDNTLAILRYRLAGIQVERDYDESLPRITAHGGELNQVWTNPIDNALDAVADGDQTGRIRLRTTHERDRLLVEISDNGPGIPEEIQDRIFEPFFTTKDVGKGAGFGLDVSYGSSSADTAGTSGSSLNPATPAFRSDCPWKRNAECCPIFDEPLAVVTFHGDQTSRDVIRETSVPPLGSSTTREPTPAVVAVGRYGDVTTTAPASHLCSAAHPVWGHGVREIPDFCCELEPSDVCLSTGTLGQDTQGLPPRRCRGPAERSASQRVGGSPNPLCSHMRAEAS